MATEVSTVPQNVPVKPNVDWMKEIKSQDLGLRVLAEPTTIDDIEVDIVAVHGIGVHPEDTWVHKKSNTHWLAHPTMLPAAFPNARIMTFGYKSYWFGKDAVKQTLDGVAGDLLEDLGEKRASSLHRPIIFVGHCFGGLVLQQAYSLATNHPKDYPGISVSVTGMVFLGTPHQGVNGNSEFQTQGQIYKAVVEANLQIQDNILHTLAHNNDLLVHTVHNFTRTIGTLGELGPKLFCFWEQKTAKIGGIAGINVTPDFVVDESSGTLSGHLKGALPLDHFGMNKFEDPEDNNYKSVRRQIGKMVIDSKAIINRRGLGKATPRGRLLELEAPGNPVLWRESLSSW